jgi:hypothetical protein
LHGFSEIIADYFLILLCSIESENVVSAGQFVSCAEPKKVKGKISLLQAMEAHRVARG